MRRKACRAVVAVLGLLGLVAVISASGQRAPAAEPKKSMAKPDLLGCDRIGPCQAGRPDLLARRPRCPCDSWLDAYNFK
jgi:hypothetical protein